MFNELASCPELVYSHAMLYTGKIFFFYILFDIRLLSQTIGLHISHHPRADIFFQVLAKNLSLVGRLSVTLSTYMLVSPYSVVPSIISHTREHVSCCTALS